MGGVAKAVSKVFGGGGSSAPQPVEVKSSTQAVEQGTFQDSEERQRKKNVSRGKKRLQIPTSSTAPTTAGGGVGLGTGV